MNPRNFGGSVWLLLFGTATVLLIGAFARFDTGTQPAATTNAPAAPPVALVKSDPAPEMPEPITTAGAPTLPADLTPGLGEIIKLAQAHIAEDTLLAYITNSGQAYNPSADEVLYLSDLGISDKVIAALFKKPDAPTVAPVITPAPPATPAATPMPSAGMAMLAAAPESMIDPPPPVVEPPAVLQNPQDSYFYNDLSPYGSWLNTADGYAWQPSVAVADSNWMPYRNRGHWAFTDDGWFWNSDYSWGWAAFHYGRWNHDGRFGWVWVPGNEWGPAWVAWRGTEGFAGWAPLPPGVHFQPGVGLFAGPSIGGLDVSFGVSASWFTFVPHEHFLSRNIGRFAVNSVNGTSLFKRSTPVNNYSTAGRRVLNVGVSPDVIAAATKSAVPKLSLEEAPAPGTGAGRGAKSLAVYRPNITPPAKGGTASPAAKPMMINQTPRPATAAPAIPRTASSRPAAPASDYASQNSHPTYAAPKVQTGFASEMFRPAPTHPAPSSFAPMPTLASRAPLNNGSDFRSVPTPSGPAPAVNYPSYNQRGFGSASSPSAPSASAAASSGGFGSSPPRGATGYGAGSSVAGYGGAASAPPRAAAGGGGPSGGSTGGHSGGGGQGGSSGGSGSQSGSSKATK